MTIIPGDAQLAALLLKVYLFRSFELTHQITDFTQQVGNVSVNTRGFGLARGGLNSATRMRTALQTASLWTAAVTVEGTVEDTKIYPRQFYLHSFKWF